MADEFKVFEIDDSFDPLEDLHMDVESDEEEEAETDYQVPDFAPEDQAPLVVVQDTESVKEHMEHLFTGMPGQKNRLLAAVALCRERTSLDSLSEQLQEQFPNDRSVYAPPRVAQLLERAGALVSEREEPNQDSEEAEQGAEGEAQGSAVFTLDADAANPDTAISDTADAANTDAVAPSTTDTTSTDAIDNFTNFDADDADDEEEYLVVAPPAITYYTATEEGLALVDELLGSAPILETINENDGRYRHVYEIVLANAAKEGGTTSKQLDTLLAGDPILEHPRRFSTYFLRKLEQADALRWLDAWVITDTGRAVLKDEFGKGE